MPCVHCSAAVVAIAVPPAVRAHAPAEEVAVCTRCLRITPADAAVDASARSGLRGRETGAGTGAGPEPEAATETETETAATLSAIDPAFPAGEAGVALALCCGQLDSLVHNRSSITALIEYAERAGVDVFSFFERLDAEHAAFDLERRRKALYELL